MYQVKIVELGENRVVLDREVQSITMIADTSEDKQLEVIINNSLMGIAQQLLNSKKILAAAKCATTLGDMMSMKEDELDEEVQAVGDGDQ